MLDHRYSYRIMENCIEGQLKTWNEEKGFGFITPLNGGQDIFVHVSNYPKAGGKPRIGETLTFNVALNEDGKKKAINVQRPGASQRVSTAVRKEPVRRNNSFWGRLAGVALLAALAFGLYQTVAPRLKLLPSAGTDQATSRSASPSTLTATPAAIPSAHYTCDGRRFCSQMTSCEEATYFLRNCPNTEMDGDNDGVPCESQWCTGPFSR